MTTNGAGAPAGPLAHIKVLDLCHARAGPTCVRVLADHGAQVIQVIRPGEGGVDASFPNFDRAGDAPRLDFLGVFSASGWRAISAP